MEYIDLPIEDPYLSQDLTIYRDGFAFTSICNPTRVLNAIILRSPGQADCQAPKVGFSTRTLDEHIALIRQHQLKRALVIAEDLHFLRECPSLQMLEVIPAKTSTKDFDYSPLYDMPNLIAVNCCTQVGDPYAKRPQYTTLDYSRLPRLQDVCISGKGHCSLAALESLRSIQLIGSDEQDLSNILGSKQLDSIYLLQSKAHTLQGLEKTRSLRCASFQHCRGLHDIDALQSAADTLTCLQISGCPKIQDFSVLNRLHSLEYLALFGSNALPNLDFIGNMPNLKTFLFSMEVLSGDLRPCLGLSYVYSERNRRYYNVKEQDLPKNRFYQGLDGIEPWRQHL